MPEKQVSERYTHFRIRQQRVGTPTGQCTMYSTRLAFLLFATVVLYGCSVRFVDVPEHVFTIYDEVVALQAVGKAGTLKHDVKIPTRRLRKVAGDPGRIQLFEYTRHAVKDVPYRRIGDSIIADLVAGQTYLMRAEPLGAAANAYALLCQLEIGIGVQYLGPWADRICPYILCPADPIYASEMFAAIPDLEPFGESLGIGNMPIGGWGREAQNVCGRCNDYGTTLVHADGPTILCPVQTPSPSGPEIAFVTERDGNSEIYVMNADGSNQTNLTQNPAFDFWPRWSPNGGEIVFVSARDGNSEIYIMNADGSAQTRLTSAAANDTKPSWSSDGQRIFFTSNRDGAYQIYRLERNAGQPSGWSSPILLPIGGAGYDIASSPDAQTIVLSAYDSGVVNVGRTDIYRINVNGAGLTNLTNSSGSYDDSPSWYQSPTIAFRSTEGGGGIFTMDDQGGGRARVTSPGGFDVGPIWSPDGNKIAFRAHHRDGNWEVYVVNKNGSGLRNLSQHPANDGANIEQYLSWSPDSGRIVFASDRDGNSEIYVVSLGTGAIDRLTNHSAIDYFPQWKP